MSNLRTRSKNRKIKRRFLKFVNLFKFKTNNLDIFLQVVIIWIILSIVSLFLPWIDIASNIEKETYNSFSYLTWMIGYFLIFLDIFLLFIAVSNRRKEKFKLNTRLFFRDNSVIIISWILILIFSLNTFFLIKWLAILESSYVPGKWLILSFVSAIIIIFAGIMENKKTKLENYSLVTNDSNTKEKNIENDRNMKLPFDY